MSVADFLSLHVPSLPSTREMINAERLALMKDGAFLINLSRGDVISEQDVYQALKSGKLRGVALDVYQQEPRQNPADFQTIFQDFDNVILTPHIGGATEEAQVNLAREVSQKIINYLRNGEKSSALNL